MNVIFHFKAAKFHILVFIVSHNFPHKPIIEESYRLLPFHASKISLLSKIKIFKVNRKGMLHVLQ